MIPWLSRLRCQQSSILTIKRAEETVKTNGINWQLQWTNHIHSQRLLDQSKQSNRLFVESACHWYYMRNDSNYSNLEQDNIPVVHKVQPYYTLPIWGVRPRPFGNWCAVEIRETKRHIFKTIMLLLSHVRKIEMNGSRKSITLISLFLLMGEKPHV